MLPASIKGPGLSFGFPDVCLTPILAVPVPIPYPNAAAHAMAVGFVPNVLLGMMPALNLASVIPKTTGDESGSLHWTYTGQSSFVTGNPVVFVGMLPGICLTCPTMNNKTNCRSAAVVAPGMPNVLYTLARAPADDGSEHASGALLDGPPLADEGFAREGVGYLRVNVFSFRLPAAMEVAVRRLLASGMRALVLDLRGCPGGELSACLELASDFLDGGADLVTMIDTDGDEVRYVAQRAQAYGFPVALLVDGGTASAAELFAGCLATHRRAVVVGAPTYGKRTGQMRLRTASGSAEAVTVARFSTRGARIDAQGRVTPDLEAREGDALAVALAHLEAS